MQLNSLLLSRNEVVHTFHQPFKALINPELLRPHAFRGGEPYFAANVTEQVKGKGITFAASTGLDEVGGSNEPGRLEVWGLTGWYTNLFMRLMDLYPMP